MTDNNHPITPPPELVEQWCHKWTDAQGEFGTYLATQAARWGADQELEACCEWLVNEGHEYEHVALRDARRPKPLNLKELALETFNKLEHLFYGYGRDGLTIRRALESLPD